MRHIRLMDRLESRPFKDQLLWKRPIFSSKQITDPSQLKMGMQVVTMSDKHGRLERFTVLSGVIINRIENYEDEVYILGQFAGMFIPSLSHRIYLAGVGIIPYFSSDGQEIGWNPNNWCYAE